MIDAINKMSRLSRAHLQEFGVEPDVAIVGSYSNRLRPYARNPK
jgi:hypothetical protein